MYVKEDFNLDALRDAGVTEIWSQTAFGHPELTWTPQDGYVVARTNGPGVLTTPLLDGKVINHSLTKFTIQASGPGELVFRQRNIDGWQATVNGQPAVLKEGNWLTVDLPDQPAVVEFRYVSPGFQTGSFITLFGLIVLAGWFVFVWRDPKSPGDIPEGIPLETA